MRSRFPPELNLRIALGAIAFVHDLNLRRTAGLLMAHLSLMKNQFVPDKQRRERGIAPETVVAYLVGEDVGSTQDSRIRRAIQRLDSGKGYEDLPKFTHVMSRASYDTIEREYRRFKYEREGLEQQFSHNLRNHGEALKRWADDFLRNLTHSDLSPQHLHSQVLDAFWDSYEGRRLREHLNSWPEFSLIVLFEGSIERLRVMRKRVEDEVSTVIPNGLAKGEFTRSIFAEVFWAAPQGYSLTCRWFPGGTNGLAFIGDCLVAKGVPEEDFPGIKEAWKKVLQFANGRSSLRELRLAVEKTNRIAKDLSEALRLLVDRGEFPGECAACPKNKISRGFRRTLQ